MTLGIKDKKMYFCVIILCLISPMLFLSGCVSLVLAFKKMFQLLMILIF